MSKSADGFKWFAIWVVAFLVAAGLALAISPIVLESMGVLRPNAPSVNPAPEPKVIAKEPVKPAAPSPRVAKPAPRPKTYVLVPETPEHPAEDRVVVHVPPAEEIQPELKAADEAPAEKTPEPPKKKRGMFGWIKKTFGGSGGQK